jgi:hypothetical protein
MKYNSTSKTIFLAATLGLALPALANKYDDIRGGGAPGTITEGTATYDVTGFDGGLDWRTSIVVPDGPAATDRLWASGWAYRLMGDTQESNFGAAPSTSDYTGNVATFTWSDVNGLGAFDASLVVELSQPNAGEAVITRTLTIENISDGSITIDVFNYEDFDINGSFGNDTAALTNDPDHITIIDGPDTGEYRAGGNTNFQVTAFQVLLLALEDAAVTDLDGSGLPFGPGDFTGAFQWSMVEIPLFGSYTVQTTNGFGALAPTPADPVLIDDVIWRDSFETSAPPVF